jgi:hypothetical protein
MIGRDPPGGTPAAGSGSTATEEFIARADVRELAGSGDRFLRLFAPHLAEEIAVERYVRRLLASGRWEQIHIVPHLDDGRRSDHVFDFYGAPRGGDQAGARRATPERG